MRWSPTSLYYKNVKIPLLESSGLEADLDVEKTGFYPKGGGKLLLETENFAMESFDLIERGRLQRLEVFSKASKDLEENSVGQRQASEAVGKLEDFTSREVEGKVEYVESDSTGSAVLIKAVYDNSVAGFDALGEKGKSSEEVASEAFEDFKSFHDSGACVDEYMADQLMVFSAIVGGEYTVPEITSHVKSNAYVIEKFGFSVDLEKLDSRALIRSGDV